MKLECDVCEGYGLVYREEENVDIECLRCCGCGWVEPKCWNCRAELDSDVKFCKDCMTIKDETNRQLMDSHSGTLSKLAKEDDK